jgi:hypothetical protein
MKSIISGAAIATAIVACLTINVQAKSINYLSLTTKTIAVSDTGKMDKMDKMDKMKKRKMDKMSKGKKKMAKDTSGKM